jgi:hypothetical protein
MEINVRLAICSALGLILGLLPFGATAHGADVVAYAGGAGADAFTDALQLSDGSFLLAGGSDNLDWIPSGVPRTELDAGAIQGQPGTGRIGYLLHLSADLKTIQRVVHLPQGATEGIRRLRSSNRPGEPTGAIFISGATVENKQGESGTGYFVARLDGNFVEAAPRKLQWVHNIWAGGEHRQVQPWDVGSDGKVVYINGREFGYDWVGLYRLSVDGRPEVVPDWRFHAGTDASGQFVSGHWTPASARSDVKVDHSGVVFKASRADLRSWTQEDYDAVEPDGNGKTRKGRWPNDYYFSGPADPAGEGGAKGGPGYTGYRLGRNPTHRVVAVAVDRRDNSMYVGYGVQSRLPDGLPDFEPAVIAYTPTGKMKWWSRLYEENDKNSTPDQYVDGIAIDYANDALIVLARCHGNNVVNLWEGKGTFKQKLNGKTGNVHISWLGSLALEDGSLKAATYVAELAAGTPKGLGKPVATGLIAGWPAPNDGWADLNTTRGQDVRVDADGRVYLIAVGRRPITTSNAFQQMPKPSEGESHWSAFVRVYEPGFTGLAYSSILNADWDKQTGSGGVTLNLSAVTPTDRGVLVAGSHPAYTQEQVEKSIANAKKAKPGKAAPQPLSAAMIGAIEGAPIITSGIPAWAQAQPVNQDAVVAHLQFDRQRN